MATHYKNREDFAKDLEKDVIEASSPLSINNLHRKYWIKYGASKKWILEYLKILENDRLVEVKGDYVTVYHKS